MVNTSISVVIPAYNCEQVIAKSLHAILNQSYSVDEVIVVDDGSTDQTAVVVKEFSDVKYFRQDNAGPSVARNRGAQESSGDIIFFTDSDCIPQDDWIEKAIKYFDDLEIGVVCGSYGIANAEYILARSIHSEILFRHQRLMSNYPQAFGSYNFGIRRTLFNQVNGFDVSYRYASGEDNDLSYKVLKTGFKIYFAKDSLVDHFHTTKIIKYLKEQCRHGFWRAKMYFDHPKMMGGDGYTFWKDIFEVCIVMCILFATPFMFFEIPLLNQLVVTLLILLSVLELFFSFMITKSFFEVFFVNFVMFFRSFVRVFGLSSGIGYFFIKNMFKKS